MGTKQVVSGKGPVPSEWMFVGEAPGREEDRVGMPLVGASGRLFDKLLKEDKIDRGAVFVTNVVKHRPPENRKPKISEIKACAEWLKIEIRAVKPKTLVTLGKVAAEAIVRLTGRVEKVSMEMEHGQGRKRVLEGEEVWHVCMYHPAAVFRQPELWPVLVMDFQKLQAVRTGGVGEYRLVEEEELERMWRKFGDTS